MATASDALARGFILPAGADLVSGGDDAIRTNAIASATALDSIEDQLGDRPIKLDTDGQPYIVTTGDGTHVILTDADGPYTAPALSRSLTVSDGTPILS